MASWNRVTIRFIDRKPTQEQLTLINNRLEQKDVPPGGEGASIRLADYDFPGLHPNGMEGVLWRSPTLATERFKSILHIIGFPNEGGHVEGYLEDDDFSGGSVYINVTPSSGTVPDDVLKDIKALFPEFIGQLSTQTLSHEALDAIRWLASPFATNLTVKEARDHVRVHYGAGVATELEAYFKVRQPTAQS